MSTYVISDIHGWYKEFQRMLKKIHFSDADRLILAGDSIERGKKTYDMLKWMEQRPENVWLIRGNHEEEFASYIDLMLCIDGKRDTQSDFTSNQDALALYGLVNGIFRKQRLSVPCFDRYGTIGSLLGDYDVNLNDLCRWMKMIRDMPYYYETEAGGRPCVIVHAGYAENVEEISALFPSLEDFYLYAREESCQLGGKRNGMVIAGHTPTIVKEVFSYNRGKVFRCYDQEKDCVFYDIDCGCAFRRHILHAKLACIRIEDEKIFYV